MLLAYLTPSLRYAVFRVTVGEGQTVMVMVVEYKRPRRRLAPAVLGNRPLSGGGGEMMWLLGFLVMARV